MVVARNIGGVSSASVVVALVVAPVIPVTRTYVVVVLIWTVIVAAVEVSGVLLKVMLLPGVGIVYVWSFLFLR